MTLRARRTRYTYEDYAKTPDDVRYQLIGGELILSPSPTFYHQDISAAMFTDIRQWAVSNGAGKVVCTLMDVYFTETDTVQPDILFISTERMHIVEDRYVRGGLTWLSRNYRLRHRDSTSARRWSCTHCTAFPTTGLSTRIRELRGRSGWKRATTQR